MNEAAQAGEHGAVGSGVRGQLGIPLKQGGSNDCALAVLRRQEAGCLVSSRS